MPGILTIFTQLQKLLVQGVTLQWIFQFGQSFSLHKYSTYETKLVIAPPKPSLYSQRRKDTAQTGFLKMRVQDKIICILQFFTLRIIHLVL